MKNLFKPLTKYIALTTAVSLCAAIMCSCSIGKSVKTNTHSQAPQTSSESELSPEQKIIGKWSVESAADKDGKNIDLEDIDLSGTPLESYMSVIGIVLKKDVTIEFKSDKTIPLLITYAEYEINEDTLTISVPAISSQPIKTTYKMSGDSMKLYISDYTINLSRK